MNFIGWLMNFTGWLIVAAFIGLGCWIVIIILSLVFGSFLLQLL